MVVALCLLRHNWLINFSPTRNCWFTWSEEKLQGRILNQPGTEVSLHQELSFLPMRDQHQPVRFLPELYRIGTVVLLWADGHLAKDWFRTDFTLPMVL